MDLTLNFGKVVSQFIWETVTGTSREVACFGTRGDGKTIGAMFAMLAHAQKHKDAGFPLPCKWIGVADTFESHKEKTFGSLRNPLWNGIWKESEGGKLWRAADLVELHLFGVPDAGDIDKCRTETVGVWFEEPAPAAVLVQSSGVNVTAWTTGITSQGSRMPSYKYPAIMTLNYPDEDHWTWQRFVEDPQPGTTYFRIPPGERASPSDRIAWSNALANRPDLLRRLINGEPGTVMLGQQVASGFNEDKHIHHAPLRAVPGEALLIGQDGGLTPTAIIGQAIDGYIAVLAALTIERGGMRQLYEQKVIPWLVVNAPWALRDASLIRGVYDSSMPDDESDSDLNPIKVILDLIGGRWEPGPVSWDARNGMLISAINMQTAHGPALRVDRQNCTGLIRALSGRWYYSLNRLGGIGKDIPHKPNHPWEDYGDAFCYFLSVAVPILVMQSRPGRRYGNGNFHSDIEAEAN